VNYYILQKKCKLSINALIDSPADYSNSRDGIPFEIQSVIIVFFILPEACLHEAVSAKAGMPSLTHNFHFSPTQVSGFKFKNLTPLTPLLQNSITPFLHFPLFPISVD
jgi:hypothetical protein